MEWEKGADQRSLEQTVLEVKEKGFQEKVELKKIKAAAAEEIQTVKEEALQEIRRQSRQHRHHQEKAARQNEELIRRLQQSERLAFLQRKVLEMKQEPEFEEKLAYQKAMEEIEALTGGR